jgi:hypothetical protein
VNDVRFVMAIVFSAAMVGLAVYISIGVWLFIDRVFDSKKGNAMDVHYSGSTAICDKEKQAAEDKSVTVTCPDCAAVLRIVSSEILPSDTKAVFVSHTN